MSSALSQQIIPLTVAIAPFPEGFQGDMDETFQQAVQLMTAYVEGNFLTGLILPPGSSLPTNDQGPIAMGGIWYFWDTATGQYLPQSIPVKATKNFARNCVYQVAQTGTVFTLGAGITKTFDMAIARTTIASVLAIAADTGVPASGDNDFIPTSIKYTVGPTLVPTLAATDIFSHEHVFEGADIAPLQGQVTALKFWAWANQAGTYSAYLSSAGRDCSFVAQFSIPVASTWTLIKIPSIPAFPTGVGTWNYAEGVTGLYFGIPMGVGSQWEVPVANLNTWQPAFYAGTSANLNLLTVLNNQLKITGVKLEAASTNTYLAVPSFSADLDDLIRYYFTTFNYQSLAAGVPIVGDGEAGHFVIQFVFPKRMCKAPVVVPCSWSNPLHVGKITDVTTSTDYTLATIGGATPKGLGVDTTIAGIAAGDIIWALINADARLS